MINLSIEMALKREYYLDEAEEIGWKLYQMGYEL